ncbi:MAG: hypothetical protein NVSMB42_22880 [Herpetosiphon sp.]
MSDAQSAQRDSRIDLADGRHLAFAEYGNLSGRPLLYFHGMPGGRQQYRDAIVSSPWFPFK